MIPRLQSLNPTENERYLIEERLGILGVDFGKEPTVGQVEICFKQVIDARKPTDDQTQLL